MFEVDNQVPPPPAATDPPTEDLFRIDLNQPPPVPPSFRRSFVQFWRDGNNQALMGLSIGLFSLQFLPHWWTALVHNFPLFILYALSVCLVLCVMFLATLAFTAAWLFGRPDPRHPTRYGSRAICLLLCLGMFPLLAWCNIALARGLPFGSFARSFDSTVWKDPSTTNWVHGDISVRQKMLGDAIRKAVTGHTKEHIVAALGSPDDAKLEVGVEVLTYCTGPERGFISIDMELLEIWVDPNGLARRIRIRTD